MTRCPNCGWTKEWGVPCEVLSSDEAILRTRIRHDEEVIARLTDQIHRYNCGAPDNAKSCNGKGVCMRHQENARLFSRP
jgi:hypothetical protein